MKVCCVDGCDATAKQDITYFQFPIKPALRRKWREAMRLTAKIPSDALVCSQHFTADDIDSARGRIRLKAKVVPSIFQKTDAVNASRESSPTLRKSTENSNPPVPESETHEDTNSVSENSTDSTRNNQTDDNTNDNNTVGNNTTSNNTTSNNNDGNIGNIYQDGYGYNHDEEMEDDGTEKCTVECVPEAILHHDSDTNSENELPKEDIEDIIANYHIKQDKTLAERLKASIEEPIPEKCDTNSKSDQSVGKNDQSVSKSDKNVGKSDQNVGKSDQNIGKSDQSSGKSDQNGVRDKNDSDFDCIEVEVEFQPAKEKEPVFVEISVGGASTKGETADNDCLMLLENVQVDIDPAMLLDSGQFSPGSDNSVELTEKKEDPVSLLTSSDDDDVIIEEPHIDTVEVSDEDEDDVPLVKLVEQNVEQSKLTKLLWGNLNEYFCMSCHYKTTNRSEFQYHKKNHCSKVFQVCDICNFSTASKSQFRKHKKSHDGKRFKCHLCDYKAKHNMSLVYHLKSHEEGLTPIKYPQPLSEPKNVKLKCGKCKVSLNKKDLSTHSKSCKGKKVSKVHSCKQCSYGTKRRSDLRRHKRNVHHDWNMDDDDDNDD